MRIVVVVVVLASTAHADVRWDVHAGGGLEGGTITPAPRPDAVAQAGTAVELLLPGRDWGVGFDAEATERLTPKLDSSEEVNLDLTLRLARHDRRMRGGFGAGVRVLSFTASETAAADQIVGVDLMRLDLGGQLVRWHTALGAELAVELYGAWTFGCYRGTRHARAVGDMLPTGRDLACLDTITTTYVGGLQTSITWR